MIAPDETTFDYLEGRPHAPQGADWDAAVAVLAHAAPPTTTRCSTARSCIDAADLAPFVTWGTNPGQGVPLSARGARPGGLRRRGRARPPPSGRWTYMGLTAGHAAARHRGRHRVRRLVHQRPHRGPARGRRGPRRAARSPTACGCSSCRARCACGSQAEAEGLDEVFTAAGRRVAQRRLLDVPGHEPRPARAGRAQRVDVQPQLRGPAGQGRPHPPRLAAGRRGHRGRRPPGRPADLPPVGRRRSGQAS